MSEVCVVDGKKVLYTASTSGHLRAFHTPCLRWLKDFGCTVHIAAGGDGEELICDRYIPLPLQKRMWAPGNFIISAKLAGLIRRERYDLVITNTSLAAFFVRLALMLASKKNTRTINIVHGYLFDDDTFFLKRALLLAAEKLTAGVTDLVLTMNHEDTETAQARRLSKSGVRQVPGMGVEFGRFLPASAAEKQAARAALGLPPEAFVLLFAAEFSKRKNHEFLLRALSELPENVCLLLPGSGALLDASKRLAEQLSIDRRVLFPGYVKDIAPFYRAADLCVSSSRIEGLPFNVIEGMRCGLVPVVTRIKGHADLVLDGTSGFLYPFGDEAAFRAVVLRLMKDRDLRAKMGEQAHKAVSGYSREDAMAAITSVFAQWLPGKNA